jgi:hypothetical protein
MSVKEKIGFSRMPLICRPAFWIGNVGREYADGHHDEDPMPVGWFSQRMSGSSCLPSSLVVPLGLTWM